uniref:Uncharacterized protein n=1 Tax=Glycine max TaxID=3847 RepID=C6TCP1_SOYBN|nr:unknown [Glycine max]
MIMVTFLWKSLKFHAADTGRSIITYQKIMLIKVRQVEFCNSIILQICIFLLLIQISEAIHNLRQHHSFSETNKFES